MKHSLRVSEQTGAAAHWGKITIGYVILLSYLLGPAQWRSATTFHYINMIRDGMQLLGFLVGVGTTMVFNGVMLGNLFLRAGYALLTGVYGAAGFAMLWTCRPHGESLSGPVLGVMFLYFALMCYQSAVDQPALRWKIRGNNESRK